MVAPAGKAVDAFANLADGDTEPVPDTLPGTPFPAFAALTVDPPRAAHAPPSGPRSDAVTHAAAH